MAGEGRQFTKHWVERQYNELDRRKWEIDEILYNAFDKDRLQPLYLTAWQISSIETHQWVIRSLYELIENNKEKLEQVNTGWLSWGISGKDLIKKMADCNKYLRSSPRDLFDTHRLKTYFLKNPSDFKKLRDDESLFPKNKSPLGEDVEGEPDIVLPSAAPYNPATDPEFVLYPSDGKRIEAPAQYNFRESKQESLQVADEKAERRVVPDPSQVDPRYMPQPAAQVYLPHHAAAAAFFPFAPAEPGLVISALAPAPAPSDSLSKANMR